MTGAYELPARYGDSQWHSYRMKRGLLNCGGKVVRESERER